MSHSERIEELLSGYPDQLSDEELAELRLAADQDPEIESTLDAIHEVELLLSADEESLVEMTAPPVLSEVGEERLAKAMGVARELAAGAAADARAVQERERQVVPLRRLGDNSQWAGWTALAAGLLLAVGTVVLSRSPAPGPSGTTDLPVVEPDEFAMKGAAGEVSGSLMIRDASGASWTPGEPRPLDQPVRFYAVVPQPVYLALLEVQAANTLVLFPAAGQESSLPAGTHVLRGTEPSGEYRPARGGAAQYVLVGSTGALQLPAGRVVTSVAALLAGNPGARELARAEIEWLAAN